MKIKCLYMLLSFMIFTGCSSNSTQSYINQYDISQYDAKDGRVQLIEDLKTIENRKFPGGISLKEAEVFIGSSRIREFTTDEIWGNFNGQVFSIDKDGTGVSYLIQHKKIVELCRGVGGFGIESMCVSDLDNDRKPELFYSFDSGSGVNNHHFGVYTDGKVYTLEEVFVNTPVSLYKTKDNKIMAVYHYDGHSFMIGRVQLSQNGAGKPYEIKLNEDIPDEIKKNIQMK